MRFLMFLIFKEMLVSIVNFVKSLGLILLFDLILKGSIFVFSFIQFFLKFLTNFILCLHPI